ncbi:unnamed protein product [Protopolystoma xenopodis]|uniref:UBC core domain-containing protein n=1 Tax=Protopolystoma xenopodis TaxID=117903 RepID=A0A448WI05_9PLAT|nr:unnamed protein product [Protopolystoma xenopodis]
MTSGEKGISAFPEGENINKWVATLAGPEDTVWSPKTGSKVYFYWPHCHYDIFKCKITLLLPYCVFIATILSFNFKVYQGQVYRLSLEFGSGYPYSPPTVRFLSRCYHPNVDGHGNICLDILKEKWSALLTVTSILVSIRSLLAEPNNDSPLNTHAAGLWDDVTEFKREMIKFQASTPVPDASSFQ